jgi:hypothetical protein
MPILASLSVKGLFADPQFPTNLRNLLAPFRLPQRLQNLLLRVTLPRHSRVLPVAVENHVQPVCSTYSLAQFSGLGQFFSFREALEFSP